MKIIHSAALLSPSAGMLKQMQWEQESAKHLQYDWHSYMYCPSGDNHFDIPKELQSLCHYDNNIIHTKNTKAVQKIQNWFFLRKNYYQWLASKDCDAYLLRYYVHDYLQYKFIKSIKKPVFLIHHSFEVPELALPNTFSAFIRSFAEKKIGVLSLNAAFGLIGVTPEIILYEQNRLGKHAKNTENCLIYPNGFSFTNSFFPSENRDLSNINILFVATNFDSWHGLDLLINELKITNSSFTLHIVGKISSVEKSALINDSRIKLYSSLSSSEIQNLSAQCDIGLSSFALNRKNMEQACTLKVREYLSNGLPVYSGHKDIFPNDFQFYKYGKPHIPTILEYAKQMKAYSKRDVITTSSPFIDKEALVKELYSSIKQLISSSKQV